MRMEMYRQFFEKICKTSSETDGATHLPYPYRSLRLYKWFRVSLQSNLENEHKITQRTSTIWQTVLCVMTF